MRVTNQRLNRRVTVPEIQIYRVGGGKMVERWFVVNRADLQPT